MPLVTLADIKTYMGIDALDVSQDALLTMFQESIEATVTSFCGTDFSTKTVTNEVLDGVQSDVIVPRHFPVLAVDAVIVGTEPDGSGGLTLDPATDYSFNSSAIFLKSFTPFARASVRVDYQWGYAAVPGDVKMAVYQAIKAEMQRHARNTEDVGSRSKGDETESYTGVWDASTGLPKTVVSKLAAYRDFEFPMVGMAQRNS